MIKKRIFKTQLLSPPTDSLLPESNYGERAGVRGILEMRRIPPHPLCVLNFAQLIFHDEH